MRAPQADFDLDMRSLRAWLALDDDGTPEVELRCDEGTPDERTVSIGVGLGGSWQSAITAAEATASCLLAYADMLRRTKLSTASKTDPHDGRQV